MVIYGYCKKGCKVNAGLKLTVDLAKIFLGEIGEIVKAKEHI
jgi:hypothetical protein